MKHVKVPVLEKLNPYNIQIFKGPTLHYPISTISDLKWNQVKMVHIEVVKKKQILIKISTEGRVYLRLDLYGF